MKKSNGTDYKQSVIKTMWNLTAKMLQEMYKQKYKVIFDPFRDREFKKARESRDMKIRELQSHPEKCKTSLKTLSDTERQKIYLLWDEDTPNGLQRKFFHIAFFELRWKGREAVNCLTQFFRKETDQFGNFTGRIEYNPNFAKEEVQEPCITKWLRPNSQNPSICPVRLFLKIMDHRKRSSIKTNRFFLTPNPFWNKTERSAWYKDSPVGKNQICSWTKEAAEKIGIDTTKNKITNASNNPSTSRMVTNNFFTM